VDVGAVGGGDGGGRSRAHGAMSDGGMSSGGTVGDRRRDG
jgi:hypothetical protein